MHLQRAAWLQAMCKEIKPVAGWQGTAGTWEDLGVVCFFFGGGQLWNWEGNHAGGM